MTTPQTKPVREWLMDLQDRISEALEAEEPRARFREDAFEEASGLARPRVLEDGLVLEKAAVNFSHGLGERLPPAATDSRPDLAGRPFEAVALSLIVHPRNPYAPTSHANFRFFHVGAGARGQAPVWWFGGGFDLTPAYGFEEDAVHWHEQARAACASLGAGVVRLARWPGARTATGGGEVRASTKYAANTSPFMRRSALTTSASPRATASFFCSQYSRLSRAVTVSLGVVSFIARPVITRTPVSMSKTALSPTTFCVGVEMRTLPSAS